MGAQAWPAYLVDEAQQEAGFEAIEVMTGVAFPTFGIEAAAAE
jgi:hypothetical protein